MFLSVKARLKCYNTPMKKIDISLVIGIIALDQLTKYLVASSMALLQSIEIIPSLFSITHARNFGASWGLFQNQMSFLILVTFIALGVMLLWYSKLKSGWSFERLGLILMFAGAIGNLIDRLRLGYVVDFFDFLIFGFNFPIFNIADVALTCGVIALLVHELKEQFYVKRT